LPNTDNLTVKEKNFLGKWNDVGLTKYGDTNAYYCSLCENIYGVTCPRCGIETPRSHISDYPKVFNVERPIIPEMDMRHYWIKVVCIKCDYRFKVIYKT
jgi:hypothetical protein